MFIQQPPVFQQPLHLSLLEFDQQESTLLLHLEFDSPLAVASPFAVASSFAAVSSFIVVSSSVAVSFAIESFAVVSLLVASEPYSSEQLSVAELLRSEVVVFAVNFASSVAAPSVLGSE